tara:strand:- start:149 stop:301 length:153 start_codon:yes stop_codon:yes gene_type:complete
VRQDVQLIDAEINFDMKTKGKRKKSKRLLADQEVELSPLEKECLAWKSPN